MQPVISPDLVNIRSMAERLSVSPRTLQTLIREGMPSVRVRGRRLFAPGDVLAWVRERGSAGGTR